jgi:uncharacterized membrane protein YebE (DUF533 family)
MFDPRKLLDQVLAGVQGQASGLHRPGESLTDTAKRYLDQGAASTGLQRPGESISDTAKRYLDQGTASAGLQGQGKGLAAGALAGGALALLLGSKSARKTATKLGGSALAMGGLALVAGLAYKAWNDYQSKQGPGVADPRTGPELLPPPSESPFHPEAGAGGSEGRARDFLVAMISAATADGHVDAAEQERIFGHLDDFGLDPEAKAFVMDELRAPLDVERIVRMATTPAMAAELYAASLLAMDPDTPAERAYLDLLAARLGLEKGLVAEIERAAEAAATA